MELMDTDLRYFLAEPSGRRRHIGSSDDEQTLCGFTPRLGWMYHYGPVEADNPPVRVCIRCLDKLRREGGTND